MRLRDRILRRLGLVRVSALLTEYGIVLEDYETPDDLEELPELQFPDEPDFDESQEWEDYDYATEVMEPMYGGDDGFFD